MAIPNALVAGKQAILAGGLAPVGAAAAPAGGSGAVAPGAGSLAFAMQTQLQNNWCWAATATSVSLFYNSTSTWTQCSVANNTLTLPSGTNCCMNGADAACDIPWYLDRALTTTGNFQDVRSGTVGFADVVSLTAAGTPLATRVGWSGGGGHFVVLHGWKKVSSGAEFVDVADPFYGTSTIPYGDFVSRYRSTGSWTHSYWTQP